MSSSLSSSSEFWEVDSDGVEKNSSSHALCMLAAWKLLLRPQLQKVYQIQTRDWYPSTKNSPARVRRNLGPRMGQIFDFPITIGSSLPPAALTKKAQVTLSLDFSPLVHCFDTSARDLFGSAR